MLLRIVLDLRSLMIQPKATLANTMSMRMAKPVIRRSSLKKAPELQDGTFSKHHSSAIYSKTHHHPRGLINDHNYEFNFLNRLGIFTLSRDQFPLQSGEPFYTNDSPMPNRHQPRKQIHPGPVHSCQRMQERCPLISMARYPTQPYTISDVKWNHTFVTSKGGCEGDEC